MNVDAFGQPIGPAVEGWTARERPPRTPMAGIWCRVEPLDVDRHATDLFEANADDADGRNWTYLGAEPPRDLHAYRAYLQQAFGGNDPMLHAIVDARTNKAVGVAAYLRIEPASGVIEVGHINYSPRLQRSAASTEAMYLMMRRAFDELGYRRYEWKCDSLNAPSRAAAQRLGFQFEGVFRQALVYKGRNRDSAWFSILDSEWPALKAEFERWLDPANFDEEGRQRTPLRHVGEAYSAVTLEKKFSKFFEQFRPKAVAQMNDYLFKLVRAEGDFVWHSHEDTDETFLVLEGELAIDFRDGRVVLKAGDLFVVPKGKEHKPFAARECRLMLIEPRGVRNTGDSAESALTAPDDVWI